MGFRPRFWPTAITLIMMAAVIGLGTWQLHRRVWKENLLATISANMSAEPVALPASGVDPHHWAFRRVRVSGRFANDHALWLYGRTFDGKVGIHLLVPLIKDDGAALLVDRGFVPFESASMLAPYATKDGLVEVDGVVREPEPAGWLLPAADPARNVWYAVDPARMSQATGLALAPFYIAASPGAPGWPAGTGGTESLGIRNEHLNYAIFWYSMALVLAAIYVLSSRSRRK